MKRHWRNLAWGAGLVLLILVAYLPAFSAHWIWDDDAYVSGNTMLRTSDGFKRIWIHPTDSPQYYPLTFTSFWIEEHLFGLSPASFHRDNILLHACSALLLWIILKRLNVPAAWFIAAVWAVHPVNVESAAWASERKNILSGFFYLLAVLTYLPFVLNEKGWWPRRYFLALFFLFLALLSKTVTATFPGAILLLIWWKRGKIRPRDVLLIVPFVLLALPFSATTSYLEHNYVGAKGPEFAYTVLQRCEIAAHDVWFYAAKDVVPINLSFIYEKWPLNNFQIIYIAALLGALGLLWILARKFGRGVLVGPLFFLGTLLPALGFVNVYPMRFSYVADHFQYLASIGVIAAVIVAINKSGPWIKGPLGRIATCTVLATLALLTYHRCSIFYNGMTLWSDALSKNPDSWMVRTNVGAVLLGRGEEELQHNQPYAAAADFSAAQVQLDRAIEIRSDVAEPWANLARVEELQGHFDLSEQWLRKALLVNNLNADTHFHLGAVMVKAGQIDQGIAEYAKAIAIDKRHVPAIVNLGVALDMKGKTQDAIDAYKYALTIDPDSVLAHVNLGNALMKLGHRSEAAEQFREALAIEPNFPPAESGLRAAGG
jgi:tetratricopeptide (TPR) repeat protein